MASKVTGYQGAVRAETGEDFDPAVGAVRYEIWRGSKAVIREKMLELKALGWRLSARKYNGGPGMELYAQRGLSSEDDFQAEVPTDRWKITRELVQIDIRGNPKVIAAAVSADTLARWMNAIHAAIDAGLSLADYYTSIGESPTVADEHVMLYNLVAMGGDSYEVHRPVLSLVRTMNADNPQKFVMDARPAVYTTDALITTYTIPPAVAQRLPVDPALKPLNTVWAWGLRQQESDILISTNRVEEVLSWTFAAWSTLLYDVIAN